MRAAVALTLLLAACAGPPAIEPLGGGDPRSARAVLQEAHRAGPVAAAVVATPPVDAAVTERLLTAAGRGVPALPVRFVAAEGEPRLVLALGPRPTSDPCAPETTEGPRVQLAFCEQGRALAAVWTTADGDLERQVQRLARTLFPDPYFDEYGLFVGPFRVLLGGSFGFGR